MAFLEDFTGGKKMLSNPEGFFFTAWWFFPTHLKNMLVKLDHLQGENKQNLKPPTSFWWGDFGWVFFFHCLVVF